MHTKAITHNKERLFTLDCCLPVMLQKSTKICKAYLKLSAERSKKYHEMIEENKIEKSAKKHKHSGRTGAIVELVTLSAHSVDSQIEKFFSKKSAFALFTLALITQSQTQMHREGKQTVHFQAFLSLHSNSDAPNLLRQSWQLVVLVRRKEQWCSQQTNPTDRNTGSRQNERNQKMCFPEVFQCLLVASLSHTNMKQ